MPPEIASFFLLFGSAGLTLLAIRIARVRKLKEALDRPASSLEAEHPGWIKLLPPGLSLRSEAPLFEVLFNELRLKPESFGPKKIAKPTVASTVEIAPGTIPAKDEVDAEQLNGLISMKSYQQSPDFVPIEAVVSNLIKNIVSVLHGKKKLKSGIEHTILDSLGAGGGFAGAKLGGIAGLAITPLLPPLSPWTLSAVIPFFVIFGAWLGSLAGKNLGERMKSRQFYACRKTLLLVSKEFKACFFRRFPELLKAIDREFEARIRFAASLRRKHSSFVTRFFFPDLLCVFFGKSIEKLAVDSKEEKKRWRQIKRGARFTHPVEFVSMIHSLTEGKLLDDPELKIRFADFEAALKELEEARKQVA